MSVGRVTAKRVHDPLSGCERAVSGDLAQHVHEAPASAMQGQAPVSQVMTTEVFVTEIAQW
jgi:hypothetical protein